jgi:hypothetical protein
LTAHPPNPYARYLAMYTYTVTFHGRHAGAIGTMQRFEVTVMATSENDALARLYEHYEHISNPVAVREIPA